MNRTYRAFLTGSILLFYVGCSSVKFAGIDPGIPNAKEITITGRGNTVSISDLSQITIDSFAERRHSERTKSGLFRNIDVIADSQTAIIHIQHIAGISITADIIQTRIRERRTETKFSKAINDDKKDGHTVAHKMLFNDFEDDAEITTREFGLFVNVNTSEGSWQLQSIERSRQQSFIFKNGMNSVGLIPVMAEGKNGKFRAGMEFQINGKKLAVLQTSPGYKFWVEKEVSTEKEALVSAIAACYMKGWL